MSTLFLLADLVILAIGCMLVAQNYRSGWTSAPTLTGIALILIVLPSFLSMFWY